MARVRTSIGTAAFVLTAYDAVVLGGDAPLLTALLGRTGSPGVWLSVSATGIVALAFEPVRVRFRGWLARVVDQDRDHRPAAAVPGRRQESESESERGRTRKGLPVHDNATVLGARGTTPGRAFITVGP